MSDDWVYTIFDRWWRPSDDIENLLAREEGHLSKAIEELTDRGTTITPELTWDLCHFVGLAACRTPEVMARGHRRMKEMVQAFGKVHEAKSSEAYRADIRARFGVELTERDFKLMQGQPRDLWVKQAKAIEAMSPQNPLFPEQIALSGVRAVAIQVWDMDLTLLDANGSDHFILGDTPLPDADLAKGFTVPLTKALALRAKPRAIAWGLPTRMVVTPNELATINQGQYDQAREVVIGPEKAVLDALP